jgi:predicted Ser/Thr protein kinase
MRSEEPVVGISVVGAIAATLLDKIYSADFNPEMAKLERRRKALEVELLKIESLRAATPEVLLRDRGNARED